MSDREALALARQHGIRMHPEGTSLVLEADRAPPPEVVHAIAEAKPELIELLAAEALARDTIERVRTGLAGYPADDAERGEREAIEAEGRGELYAPAGLTDAYRAGLQKVATMRPPRFRAPTRWWSADRTGWCTGCGRPSTWRADPPPAPSPSVLHWRCTRCFPLHQQGEASAS